MTVVHHLCMHVYAVIYHALLTLILTLNCVAGKKYGRTSEVELCLG
jgi:hypothetical protein